MDILDTRQNLNEMVLKHEQQIKDIAEHLLELQQYMEFKRREWVGLTEDLGNVRFKSEYRYDMSFKPDDCYDIKEKNNA